MGEHKMGYVAGIFAGSLVVMIRQCERCGDNLCENHGMEGYDNWTLACSIISLVFTLVLLLVGKFAPGKLSPQINMYMAIFLCLWWMAGCGTMTFKHPFKVTGNGYFGAWVALIASVMNLGSHVNFPGMPEGGSPVLAVLFLASATVMVQSSSDCDEWNYCKKQLAWMVACSVIGLVVLLVLVFVCPRVPAIPDKWVKYFLFAWWCAGASVGTFDKPYTVTGNGYFGLWAALIASAVLAFGEGNVKGSMEKGAGAAKASLPLFGLFVASVVCLAAASIVCDDMNTRWTDCQDYVAWAVACTCISVVITLVLIVLGYLGKDGAIQPHLKWVALFLLVWWIAGVWCMTFKRPFSATGNGYFSAWCAMICACLFIGENGQGLPGMGEAQGAKANFEGQGKDKKMWIMLAVCSLGLGVQSAMDCDDWHGSCKANLPWALACSWISFVACILIVVFMDKISAHIKWVALVMCIWWAAGAGVLTFDQPYTTTGIRANGYFLSWAGFIIAGMIAADAWGVDTGAMGRINLGGGGGSANNSHQSPPARALSEPMLNEQYETKETHYQDNAQYTSQPVAQGSPHHQTDAQF